MLKVVNFYSEGRKLRGKIQIPSDRWDTDGKFPCVILCHGHSRHMDDGLDVLADTLEKSGIASFRFNFSGCSQYSDSRYDLYCSSQWIKDLMSAISYVCTLPYMDSDRIATCGISMGATTSLVVSALDCRVRCNVSMAPVDDCFNWLKDMWISTGGNWDGFVKEIIDDSEIQARTGHSRIMPTLRMYNDTQENIEGQNREVEQSPDNNNYVSMASIADLLNYHPGLYAPLVKVPTFVLYGQDDHLVPHRYGRDMLDRIQCEDRLYKEYPGIDHNIPGNINRDVPFRDITEWISSHLVH